MEEKERLGRGVKRKKREAVVMYGVVLYSMSGSWGGGGDVLELCRPDYKACAER